MTSQPTKDINQTPDWELLSEFLVSDYPGGDRTLVERVAETVKSLRIQPSQLQKITEELAHTLANPRRSTQGVDLSPISLLRIWTSKDVTQGGGWGFFIVEKQSNERQLEAENLANIVELFLYQVRHP